MVNLLTKSKSFPHSADSDYPTDRQRHHTQSRPRKAGRPEQTLADREHKRQHILDAAAQVYADLDWNTLRVDDIVAAAGISRPTFYSLYANKDAVLSTLVEMANEDLMQRVVRAVVATENPDMQLRNALSAYIEWGCEIGPVVRAIYREARIPGSPAFEPRQRIFAALMALLSQQAEEAGYRPAPALLEAGCVAIEHLGAMLFQRGEQTQADRLLALEHMWRMAEWIFNGAGAANVAQTSLS